LRRIREARRLSLDTVEEMSVEFPERVTKSHLSRIENGQALPTFPRLHALGRIYGVPMATLAERYEVEARKAAIPSVDDRTEEEVRAEARRLRTQGLYQDAMLLYHALLERAAANGRGDVPELRLQVVNCLVHLGRYETAKLECEQLLGVDAFSTRERLIALHLYSFSAWKLGRLMPAMWGLEQAAREAAEHGADERLLADLASTRGQVLTEVASLAEARACLEEACRRYEGLPDPFEACRARVVLGEILLEEGALDEARRTLEGALVTAESEGFHRQQALALSHLAKLEHRRGQLDASERCAIRSNSLARPREYHAIVFRNCYLLWRIAQRRGDGAAARTNERSLRALLGKIDEELPEAEAFRASIGRES
jgi:tetratricopeptide (TPR) repeat protein